MTHVFKWDYTPASGHFAVNVMCDQTTRRLHWSTHPNLAQATFAFLRHALPMRYRVAAEITDEAGVAVLAYFCHYEPLAAEWWGCEAAFRVLELVAPPMDLILWEQRAKSCMGVPT